MKTTLPRPLLPVPRLPRSLPRGARGLALAVAVLFCGLLERDAYAQAPTPAGPEFRVNTHTASAERSPSVAMDADGDFVIAWQSQQDGTGYSIYAQRYAADGTPAGGEFRVNTFVSRNEEEPSVAMDADGDFVVTWINISSSHFSTSFNIAGQRFAADGTPQGGEFRVNTTKVGHRWPPSVAMDADGDFIVVWGQGSVVGQRYAADGTPLGTEFQIFAPGENPSVAMDTDGGFVVVWRSDGQDGSGYGIYGQRYAANGTPQGSEFQVNTFTADHQTNPSVAMDADGGFVVAWISLGQDGSGNGIYGQRYAADGTPQGGEFQVNTTTAFDQISPTAAIDADGDFVVAWHSSGHQDGSGRSIYARRYDADGSPEGGEFQVNTFTAGHQTVPSVAMDTDGDFVVAWESLFQDGDSYGVYAQRYAADSPPPPVCFASIFSETVDYDAGTVTLSITDPEGIAQVNFTDPAGNPFLNGFDAANTAGGFTSTDGIHWHPPDPITPPTSAEFVLTATQGTASYFAQITNGCGFILDIDPVHEMASGAASFAVEGNHPNPFGATTTIRFSVPEASPVTVTVYDLMGREVRTLVEGELGQGSHEVVWDGRDGSGRPVPSGMYLYRVQAGGQVETRSMTLLR